MAALAMQQALQLDGEEETWPKERDRLLLLIPEQHASALQVGFPTCPLSSLCNENVQCKAAQWDKGDEINTCMQL